MTIETRSPEQIWLDLTERSAVIPQEEAATAFANLQSISAEFLTRGDGNWQGFVLETGHPGGAQLTEMRWAGKRFHSTEDVDPVIVYDAEHKRTWNADWGHARLREMKFGNHTTIAMIYDSFPVIDYFHYVTDDIVAGIMDTKLFPGTFYFYLKRIA